MLQQTQVSRVIPKYQEFLSKFPSAQKLAQAPLGDVLKIWNGLGYNRRAKYLHAAAKKLVSDFGSKFPQKVEELTTLPGVGKNTAGAIMVYAFNQQVVFIETNVRSVFIYHFFHGRTDVSDRELVPLIEKTLDQKNPREFYWALMDYGSYLKTQRNNISNSKHYAKQSKFEGSLRQVRGKVLKQLSDKPYTLNELKQVISDERLSRVLNDLVREQLISKNRQLYSLG